MPRPPNDLIFDLQMHFSHLLKLAAGLLAAFLVCVAGSNPISHADENEVAELKLDTKTLLDQFGAEPISLYAFFLDDQREKSMAEDLLSRFAAYDRHFNYEFVDPDRRPKKATAHGADDYGVLVVESRGRRVVVDEPTESALAAVLRDILSAKSKTVYLIQGHNEPSPADTNAGGLRQFAEKLRARNFDVKEWVLADGPIPSDAWIVLLVGPHTDLNTDETGKLQEYFDSGGRLVIALDPVFPGEGKNVANFAAQLGINLGDDVIVDESNQLAGTDALMTTATEFKVHDITKNLMNPILLAVARSVGVKSDTPKNLRLDVIAASGEASWAEHDLKALENETTTYDPNYDIRGPVPIAAVAENSNGKGKMAVLGDGDLFNNSLIGRAGNARFLMNVIRWLSNEAANPPERLTSPSAMSRGKPKAVLYFKRRGDVRAVSVHARGNNFEMIRDDHGSWMLRSPVRGPVEPDLTESAVDYLRNAKRYRAFHLQNEGLEEYGLQNPRVTICLGAEKVLVRNACLRLGEDGPFFNRCYAAWAGENEIFFLENEFRNFLEGLSLYEIRQKQIFPNVTANARVIRIRWFGEIYRFVRQKDGWKMLSPLRLDLREYEMAPILAALENLHVREFVESGTPGSTKARVGGKRQMSLEVLYSRNRSTRLILGNPALEHNGYFGFVGGWPFLAILSRSKLEEVIARCDSIIRSN